MLRWPCRPSFQADIRWHLSLSDIQACNLFSGPPVYFVGKDLIFLRVVLGSQKNWEEGTELSHRVSSPHTGTALPPHPCHYPHPPPEGEPTWPHHNHPESITYWCINLGFPLGGLRPVGLGKCIMSCAHHTEFHEVKSLPWKSSVLCLYEVPNELITYSRWKTESLL